MKRVRTGKQSVRRNHFHHRRVIHRAAIEHLENRQLLSVNVLTYRDGQAGTNTSETTLSPANVKVGSFGKLSTTNLDGYTYAEPLVVSSETINSGPNTTLGAAGVYNVVYDETENDSIYAVSTISGAVLWHRSLLTTGTGTGLTAGTDINNPLGASAITAPTSSQVSCSDIVPCYGITGTPIIDLANNRMYLVSFTLETVGSNATFVQRIHAINLSDGTDQVVPYQIGTTTGTNTNTTSIYVYGTGDGSVTDPYNGTGQSVVQFNALRENERASLALVNGTLYASWASHCDDFPYHGWVASWNVANVATSGFVLTGAFCTSPNGGGAGVWGGGGGLQFDPDEANTFYLETGNGFGQASNGITLNSQGFPNGGAYFEAVVKLVSDSTTSPTNQNTNGWGLKVTDYFVPYNQAPLDNADQDLGSGSPLVLPDSAGIAGHPRLLLAAGKQGVVYVIDRDNMGHYDPNNDHVINSGPNGNGNNTPPVNVTGVLSSPTYFNGTIYYISGYSGPAYSFSLSSTGALVPMSTSSNNSFGYLPGSPVLSSNGSINGIIWQTDRNNNELHAYDGNSYATELWNSNQAAGGADAIGSVVKFASPTVANGEVFVGTAASLVIYGLQPPVNGVPSTPSLSANALSSSSVNLNWIDPTAAPNTTTAYSIEELIGSTWTVITTSPSGTSSLNIGGLAAQTSYSFRLRGLNGVGYSQYSNTSLVTTTAAGSGPNFPTGFNGAAGSLTFNGTANLSGGAIQLTNAKNQSSSVFTNALVSDTNFTTAFQFQLSSGSAIADGFTFTLQDQSPSQTGLLGGGLGYQNISNSVAVKFDLYSNSGEGTNSTGIFANGVYPTTPSVDMTASGVNLHSGDLMSVALSYDGTTLTESVTDTATKQVFSTSYPINISLYTGPTAYVGFTAGTGGEFATQQIKNWVFTPAVNAAPLAPSALGAAVASATSISLNWTANDTDQTTYLLDRATDAGFTQNLVTQTLPSTPNSFTDVANGLASGGTYYYRIRAVNLLGPSANSNVASITIPYPPAKASNCVFDSVTSTSITLHWTDNAGPTAQGYHILRSVNGGTYTLYTTLPGLVQTLPGNYIPQEYDWTDTGCTPGTFYDYHIQCFNVAGYNDFVGGNATTLTASPVVLLTVGSNSISLSWAAPLSAVSYNVYRGTTTGGESITPIAAGITTTSFNDSSAIPGVSYYYYVTAMNGNLAPLNSESAGSREVSGTIGGAQPGMPTGVIATPGVGSITLVWTPAANDFYYNVYRGTTSGGESMVPIAANLTLPTFTDSTAVANQVYYYYVNSTGSAMTTTASPASKEVSAAVTVVKLTGTAIGTSTSWLNNGDTIAQVFDGNFNTYFDAANSNLTNWAGLDLGYAQTITQIKYAPRTGYEYRMVGGQFQASSTPDFSSNVVVLATIGTAPTAGQFTTVPVSPGAAYRYVRYVGGTQWVNIAEMEVDGLASIAPTYSILAGTPIGTQTSYANYNDTINQVFDGNFSTFFDAPNSSLTNWVGLDLGTPQTISQIKYAPRATYENRMVGGQFQASSSANFSSNVVTLYTIATAPTAGILTTINVTPGGAYRYVRYVGGTQWVNIAEMQVLGVPAAITYTKFTGTPIGTQTSYANFNDTIAQVFDGSFTTFFDAPNNSLTNWVGLDLGYAQTISEIKYAPRSGDESRMVGGQFQVSSSANFSSNVVTVFTIMTAPVAGQFTTIYVSPGAAYRYVRYVGGTSWVNIAELEVDGVPATLPVYSKLSGTAIGTSTSWLNNGDTIAQVFDGNFNTYFDAPNSSLTNWVGLDLGTAQTFSQIKYAPRAGFESRMLGGQFQVSTTADFSSNVVTLYTIRTVPAAGSFTTIYVSPSAAYRYVRYVGGTSWVNIAEMEVDTITG